MTTNLINIVKDFILRKFLLRLRGECQIERLKKNGLVIGKNLNMQPGVIIDPNYYSHITIGDNVSIAARVQILAHDATTEKHLGYTRIGRTIIGDNVFLGAGSIILPGIEIGNNSIVGAGSVVTKNVPKDFIVAGNPAQILFSIEDFKRRHRKKIRELPCFGEEYSLRKNITNEMRQQMNSEIAEKGESVGYVIDPIIFGILNKSSNGKNSN